ncbi:MAG TPA: endonuclease MutS2, partial [Sphingobacteriaceae bacterium]
MIYPLSAVDKLGFTEIKELLKGYCISPMGQSLVDKMQMMTSYDQINKFLRQAFEFKNILENDSPLPLQNFYDMKVLAEKVRIEGTFLSEEDFFRVLISL